METGLIGYATNEKSNKYQPPLSGTVRFCSECGQSDRFTLLSARHFAGGKLCPGVPMELEYALVNPERARLEREVVGAVKRWAMLRFQPHFGGVVELENTMQAAIEALLAFESEQEKNNR